MITQQEIDDTCKCLLTKYTYAPHSAGIQSDVPLDLYPDELEFIWTFVSCGMADVVQQPPRPELKTDGNVLVYDCGTRQWVELNPRYIVTVEHPLFNPCCDTTTLSVPGTGWDSQEQEFVSWSEIQHAEVTCCDAIEAGTENLEHFDHDKYIADVKQYVESIEIDEDIDPWSVNFNTYSFTIDWIALFEELDFSEAQLAEKKLDMKVCGDRWKLLIQQKAEDATKFLQEQKQTLLTENQNTTKQELVDENNEEIAELDAISELILSEIGDYQTATEGCEYIQQLVEVWPPILMPMPYKRELVKVSALSAHDVRDPVDI